MLFLTCSNGPIHEVKIKDAAILKAARVFIDSVERRNSDRLTKVQFQLLMRVDSTNGQRTVFFAAAKAMSVFTRGTPDKFFQLSNHIVFVFEQKDTAVQINKVLAVRNQFKGFLFDDLNADASINENAVFNLDVYSFDIIIFRFVIGSNAIQSYRPVYDFPDARFYRQGRKFDYSGNIMYVDGVYDPISLDTSSTAQTYKAMQDYLVANNLYGGRLENISVTLTIGVTGFVSYVVIDDRKNITTPAEKVEYSRILMAMPKLKVRTLNGVPVPYRILLGL